MGAFVRVKQLHHGLQPGGPPPRRSRWLDNKEGMSSSRAPVCMVNGFGLV